MNLAIRTVEETDDLHVIEGLGIPFGGAFPGDSDSFGTRATPKTKLHLDMIPDGAKPLLWNHGFDQQIGYTPVGAWGVREIDDKGVWIRAQLDKRHAYYSAIRELLGEDALGFSVGSAEHAVRIAKNGDWIEWPVFELSLTPTPSNPYAYVSARSAEDIVSIVETATRAEDEPVVEETETVEEPKSDEPETAPEPEATRTYIPALHAAQGAEILADLLELLAVEGDEPDQAAMLQRAADALSEWIAAERAETPNEDDEAGEMLAAMSATRAGRRNSAGDQSNLDEAHQAAHDAMNATLRAGADCPDCQPGQSNDDNSPMQPSEEDAARSAEELTTVNIVERLDVAAVRAELLAAAAVNGAEVAMRLTRFTR